MQPEFPITIAEWRKNGREVIRVRLTLYKGRELIELRVYYREPSGEHKPTRKGINLPIEHLPAIKEALKAAQMAAGARGWIS